MTTIDIEKLKETYEGIRTLETYRLWSAIWKEDLHILRAERYGLDPYRPKFYGLNPRTGLPCTIVFNEPAPGRSRVMNWNTLTQCWFYSEDAGLTWERIQTTEDCTAHLEKVDCLMENERRPA